MSIDLVLSVVAHTFAVICIFDGVRRISAFGFSKSAAICTTFGLLYCIGYAGFSYWVHNFQVEASRLLHKGVTVPELAVDWGDKFSPQQRAKTSIELAKAEFDANGRLRHYFDESGERLLFSPTQIDLDEREKKAPSDQSA